MIRRDRLIFVFSLLGVIVGFFLALAVVSSRSPPAVRRVTTISTALATTEREETTKPPTRMAEHTMPVVDRDDGEEYAMSLLAGVDGKEVVLCRSRETVKQECQAIILTSKDSALTLEKRTQEGTLVLRINKDGEPHESWEIGVEEMWLSKVASHAGPTGSWVLYKRSKRLENTSLKAFMADRKAMNYKTGSNAREAYALLVMPPMDESMYSLALTAVYSLRKYDPSRDVVVMLIQTAENGEKVKVLNDQLTKLGALVYIKDPLPLRKVDQQMYYRFDYQKLFIWNLPYRKIMFIDSDIVVRSSPAAGFQICHGKYPICAVSEIRGKGGYFNNGFFILIKNGPWKHEAEKLLRKWWKPDAPWRQICLQDLLNEVYEKNWQHMPEAFNAQAAKHNILDSWCHAIFMHEKECPAKPELERCKSWHNDFGEMLNRLNS